jgi:hypothetical protein
MMIDTRLEPAVAKEMIKGAPDTMVSEFHLGWVGGWVGQCVWVNSQGIALLVGQRVLLGWSSCSIACRLLICHQIWLKNGRLEVQGQSSTDVPLYTTACTMHC